MRNHCSKVAYTRLVASALIVVFEVSIVSARVAGAANTEPVPPRGATVSGEARVIDGDTIALGALRIRLEGIDAPESAQACASADPNDSGRGGTWACGLAATRALSHLLAGREVICASHGPDKYNRMLGTCFADGVDVNAQLVERGLAWAFVKYSETYVAQEQAARARRIGIWQAPTEPAWDYRKAQWASAVEAVPADGCAIKGNVTANGRIYHMPWSPWYEKVRIEGNPSKRWFCSEAEAQAAGWRAAYTR